MIHPPVPKPLPRQHGIALLSVLLALSLMVVLAAELSDAFRQHLARTMVQQKLDQAYWYAMSGEQLGVVALQKTFATKPKTINLDQPWATRNNQLPVEEGTIAGELKDAQACFNINALATTDSSSTTPGVTPEVQVFTALLQYLGVTPLDAGQIASSTRSWVSSQDVAGTTDSNYASLPVPYLSGKVAMREVSEWRAVAGVSAALAQRAMPFLCALPTSTLLVNVNTIASDQPELLAALYIDKLPVDQAAAVLNNRPKSGWGSVAAFLSQPRLANFASTGVNQRLTVTSDYFTVTVTATTGHNTQTLNSLLRHTSNSADTQRQVTVVRRQFGATSL